MEIFKVKYKNSKGLIKLRILTLKQINRLKASGKSVFLSISFLGLKK